ncbi:hypothetical protein GALMADRAFT_552311 [Galerina marginata CBS 339.88]|uniref:Uncharacterized protein n=1 Tax=Galerina marginata (strain CBS 339.88) TaxID=685588 RepID=A0A067T618_GALM3|nr:hypothetical protein GALMADRAFT_552311 [Galerina marginata CBS 339.88]
MGTTLNWKVLDDSLIDPYLFLVQLLLHLDLKETDFSSQGETPKLSPIFPGDLSDDEDHEHDPTSRPLTRQYTPPFLIPPSTPRILVETHTSPRSASPDIAMPENQSLVSTPATSSISVQDHTPPRDAFTDVPLSPSTPPRRSTPRSSRKEFKTPSPPKGLPDLPSPSYSEDSGSNRGWTKTATAQSQPSALRDSHWMPTPRPPGGWLATPKPPREVPLDDGSTIPTDDSKGGNGQVYPSTPTNRVDNPNGANLDIIGKTPKPPGGWVSTPAPPLSSRLPEEEISEQSAGLLTPMPSLSRGSSFDPKTPGLPGGWLATPAVRKSILKVRFNSEATMAQNSQAYDHKLDAETDDVPTQTVGTPSHSDPSSPLPPSPRSPRRSKAPNIRIVDAFGKEHESIELESEQRGKSMLRVVDAMGREVPSDPTSIMEESTVEDQIIKNSSRGELLSRIRKGLDDLAEEFDGVEKNDQDLLDVTRIEELNRISNQARRNREQLHGQHLISRGKGLFSIQYPYLNSKLPRNNLRFYVTVILVQLFFFLLLYRIAINRARELFLNTYYDPFNPEVHLYVFNSDSSLYLRDSKISGVSWYSLLQRFFRAAGEKTWYNWLHLIGDMPSYFWNIWNDDAIPQNMAWLPT